MPRDAMQGLDYFIETKDKIDYINILLNVGFDVLDFGSFVSPKLVPQMADTKEVLQELNLSQSSTKLLAIVANLRGVEEAIQYPEITYLGYPFSISETFQTRNTNTNLKTSLNLVEEIINTCNSANKSAVIYLSMAFGNPYGDTWNEAVVLHWCENLHEKGVKTIALSDTTGVSTPQSITKIFTKVSAAFPNLEISVHLHSTSQSSEEKIKAAYNSGCRRFDAALKGYGGCPMAADKLTGNIATENLLNFLRSQNEELNIDKDKFITAMQFANSIFYR